MSSFASDTAGSAETVLWANEAGTALVIDEGAHLFGADFQRDGRDLLLQNDDAPTIRIVDYFTGPPADLMSGDGGLLRGATVETLAGPIAPGQYAQVTTLRPPQPIGQVETLSGTANVQRADGSVQPLRVGAKVFEGDVVATEDGSVLSLTFADGTIFSLSAASRMVLDQLIYDPTGGDNTGAFSLIQGSFVFIAGQVAKTGGMEVTTPAATMGIRGTTVKVDVTTVNGETVVQCSLNPDPDGSLGRIEIFDLDGNLLRTVDGSAFEWEISSADQELLQFPRSADDLLADSALLDTAASAFRVAIRRVASGETFLDTPRASGVPEADPESDQSPVPQPDDPQDLAAQPEGEDTIAPDPGFNTGAGQLLSGDRPEDAPEELPVLEEDVPEDPPILPAFPEPPVPDTEPSLDDTRFLTDEDSQFAGVLPRLEDATETQSYVLLVAPENGTVTIDGDGAYVFVPNADFSGTDRFVYGLVDAEGELETETATAFITVAEVNDAPDVSPVFLDVGEDGSVQLDLATLGSDIDPGEDGSTLDYQITLPGGDAVPAGSLSLVQTGTLVTLAPGPEFQALGNGEAQALVLEVTATDAAGASASAALILTVTGANDAPVIEDATLRVGENRRLASVDLSPLASDAEEAAADLTYAIVSPPSEGTATVDGALLNFEPGSDFHDLEAGESRIVTVQVSVTDGAGARSQAVVEFVVTGAADAPTLQDGRLEAPEGDAPATLDLATLAFDAEDGAEGLSYSIVTAPDQGSLTLDGAVLSFVPGAAFEALDAGETRVLTAEVAATDSTGATTTASVEIVVTGAADAPTLDDAALDTAEDGAAVSIDLATLAFDAEDGAQGLTYALVTPPPEGSATLEGTRLTFDPGADFQDLAEGETRQVTLDIAVTDQVGATTAAEVAVTVTGTNDAPFVGAASFVVAPGAGIDGQVLASDVDGGGLTFSLLTTPLRGEVTLDPQTGAFSYTAGTAPGDDSFRVLVEDGQGGSETTTIDLFVAPSELTGDRGERLAATIDPTGQVQVTVPPLVPDTANLAFVLDSSGSVGAEGWADQLAVVAEAIDAMAATYQGTAVQIDVQVISYASGVEATQTYDLLTETEALTEAVLGLEWQAGTTRWDLAFNAAEAFFASQPADEANTLFFITDGEASSPYEDALSSLEATAAPTIEAYAIGAEPDLAVLDQIDSSGAATGVPTPADLSGALTLDPPEGAELVGFQLFLVADGTDRGVIAGIEALTPTDTGFALDIASIDDIAPRLGFTNSFTAVAEFDIDGDPLTVEDRQIVATETLVSRAGGATTEVGTEGADILFGSDGGDSLDGGGDRDILLGFEGDDTLRGGDAADQIFAGGGDDRIVIDSQHVSGREKIYGGEGRDTVQIDVAGDLDAGLIPVLDLTEVEVLDIDNAEANTLTLSAADVLDIAGVAGEDIGALLEAAGPLLTVSGDDVDTVTLAVAPDQILRTADEEDGPQVTYEFVDASGDILAALAIDAEVTVQTIAAPG